MLYNKTDIKIYVYTFITIKNIKIISEKCFDILIHYLGENMLVIVIF